MQLNRLDEVFKNRKVQNRVLAKYFKKDEATISRWRNNVRQPSVTQLNEIARLLRMNIKDLLHNSDWNKETSVTYEEFVQLDKQNRR